MGCLLSLHFGIRESERRAQRREQQTLETSTGSNMDAVGSNDVLIFCPQSESFEIANNYFEIDHQKLGIPLKRIDYKWRLSELVSKTELLKRKTAFWETCYINGGQSQVWNALKLICQDESHDLNFAQSILESCGIILPYGQLTEIYDSKGFRYLLPPYCVCDPINIDDNVDQLMHESEIIVNESKDKIKIRLSDGKDILMDFHKSIRVSDIKANIRNQEQIDTKCRMVVLWCGKVLDDSTKLENLNLPKGSVLQVMIPQQ